MSSQTRYSASLPANPFAFYQSRTIAELMLDHGDRTEVKRIVHDGNLLQVQSKANEDAIFNYVYRRLELMPESLKRIIVFGEEVDARYVNLISIMKMDLLFREFVIDVYHERIMDHTPLTDCDIMSFFDKKAREDENVASWRYVTVFKLRRLYARILFEAGFLRTSTGSRELVRPYISHETIQLLDNEGYTDYMTITLGSI